MSFHGMDLPVNAAIAVPNPNFSIPTLLMTLGKKSWKFPVGEGRGVQNNEKFPNFFL